MRGRTAFVLTVLIVAFALRMFIVVRGGSFYWTDEKRYNDTREAVAAFTAGDWKGAGHFLFARSDHILFRWIALPPALVERAVYGDLPPDAKICAGWFALFSVANLALIWGIAHRTATRRREAEWALAFAASSSALFFFARHCFPYDASLAAFLAALYVSAGGRSFRRSFVVGLWCGAGYLTYNGYWSVGAVVGLLEIATRTEPFTRRIARMCATIAGLIAPIALVFGGAAICGYDLVADSLHFAGTVNQGNFGTGWRFIPEYLTVTDGGLWIGLATLAAVALVAGVARRQREAWQRWVIGAAALVAVWILFSDVVHAFVLYGRTVRALVPFLALSAAGGLAYLCDGLDVRTRFVVLVGGIASCVAGVVMMVGPLRQIFPPEFRDMAEQRIAAARRIKPGAEFGLAFAAYVDRPEPVRELPPVKSELWREPHPMQYLPYLYEGCSREQRAEFQKHDIAMRLFEIAPPSAGSASNAGRETSASGPMFGTNHGTVEMTVTWPNNAIGHSEVLVSAGRPDLGEQLYVSYVDATHVRFGFDHWGASPVLSAPIAVTHDHPQRLFLSIGALFPPQHDHRYREAPDLRFLERWLYVKLGDTVALSQPFDFFPCDADTVYFGRSIIGCSNAEPKFTGRILSVHHADPTRLGLTERALSWPPVTEYAAGEASAARVRLIIDLPTRWDVGREPLLISGTIPQSDVVFLRYVGSNRLRVGYRHGDDPALLSGTFRAVPGTRHTIDISLPDSSAPSGVAADSDATQPKTAPVCITFDGLDRIAAQASGYARSAADLHLGTTLADAKWIRMRFSGVISRLEFPAPSPGK